LEWEEGGVVTDVLERLRQEGRWQDLVSELQVRIDSAGDDAARVPFLEQLMWVERDRFGRMARAQAVAERILAIQPDHDEALGVAGPAEPTNVRRAGGDPGTGPHPLAGTGARPAHDPGPQTLNQPLGTSERPEPSGSHRVIVEGTPGEVSITYRHFEWITFVGASCLALGCLVLWRRALETGAGVNVEQISFGIFGALLAIAAVATLFNRTVVKVAGGMVRSVTWPIPAMMPRIVRIADVAEVSVSLDKRHTAAGSRAPSTHRYSYSWNVWAVLKDESRVKLVGGLDFREEREARALQVAIEGAVRAAQR